jgi:hypothetical protein
MQSGIYVYDPSFSFYPHFILSPHPPHFYSHLLILQKKVREREGKVNETKKYLALGHVTKKKKGNEDEDKSRAQTKALKRMRNEKEAV